MTPGYSFVTSILAELSHKSYKRVSTSKFSLVHLWSHHLWKVKVLFFLSNPLLLISSPYLTELSRTSWTIMNRSSDNGHSCLTILKGPHWHFTSKYNISYRFLVGTLEQAKFPSIPSLTRVITNGCWVM